MAFKMKKRSILKGSAAHKSALKAASSFKNVTEPPHNHADKEGKVHYKYGHQTWGNLPGYKGGIPEYKVVEGVGSGGSDVIEHVVPSEKRWSHGQLMGMFSDIKGPWGGQGEDWKWDAKNLSREEFIKKFKKAEQRYIELGGEKKFTNYKTSEKDFRFVDNFYRMLGEDTNWVIKDDKYDKDSLKEYNRGSTSEERKREMTYVRPTDYVYEDEYTGEPKTEHVNIFRHLGTDDENDYVYGLVDHALNAEVGHASTEGIQSEENAPTTPDPNIQTQDQDDDNDDSLMQPGDYQNVKPTVIQKRRKSSTFKYGI